MWLLSLFFSGSKNSIISKTQFLHQGLFALHWELPCTSLGLKEWASSKFENTIKSVCTILRNHSGRKNNIPWSFKTPSNGCAGWTKRGCGMHWHVQFRASAHRYQCNFDCSKPLRSNLDLGQSDFVEIRACCSVKWAHLSPWEGGWRRRWLRWRRSSTSMKRRALGRGRRRWRTNKVCRGDEG